MSNPLFGTYFIERTHALDGMAMTVNGAVNKTLFLFALLFVSSYYSWSVLLNGYTDKAARLAFGGLIIGCLFAVIIIFGRKFLHILTPCYAIAEGFFLGGISAVYAASYTGIIMHAIIASFFSFLAVLVLYRTGIIRCTERFRAVITTALLSVAAIYLIQIIAGLFGRSVPGLFQAGPAGICFSILVVLIAAASFVVDFDFIYRGALGMLPKQYEWYAAFGLMVTFIWLYIEIVNMLAKLNLRK